MKLSHLSLAILSAIALAACGGGSNDQVNPDDHNNGSDVNQGGQDTDQGKKDETTAEKDADIVDPTGDKVVDAITLAKTSTTASQQYVRAAQSVHDRINNPDKPASATALSGITLDVQNPQLTNIVIGRINDKNAQDKNVKIAQFAGSNDQNMGSLGGVAGSLQDENKVNAWVDSADIFHRRNSGFGWFNVGTGYLSGTYTTIKNNPLIGASPYLAAYKQLRQKAYTYSLALAKFNEEARKGSSVSPSVSNNLKSELKNFNDALNDYQTQASAVQPLFNALKIKGVKQAVVSIAASNKAIDDTAKNTKTTLVMKDVTIPDAPSAKDLRKYGYGLGWLTTDGNFAGMTDAGWGDYIDPATDKVVGAPADNTTFAGLPTSGLVGIYKDGTGKWRVRGDEDNNVRTTRIFGHFYRDPGTYDGIKLAPETANSWRGAATFVTGLDSSTGKPNQYGFGVEPMLLNNVQYGRVTAEIEDINVATEGETVGWRKDKQAFANREPEKLGEADDFYFYRGTNATSIDNMAKLPTDAKIKYEGHALMYGIDNSYHGSGLELPNAFGNDQNYGIGNFVSATLDMGAKKFEGDVYNAWHSPDQKTFKKDVLVKFSGDVTGNTVIGQASRTYVTEDRPADFRASFYGAKADEVGGAFNSVKREDPFGPIGWGGVFGAKKTSSGGNSWLVSSEEK